MEITVKMTPEEYDLFRVYQNEKEFFERRLREETKKFQKEHEELCSLIVNALDRPDVIWASPDCTTYSIAAISHHRRLAGGGSTNLDAVSDYAKFCDRVNLHVHGLIMALSPRFWFIENPRGGMRKMDFMSGLPRYTVTYCKYGDTRMKPTDIWTNHPDPDFLPMCHNGDPCHERAPRGAKTGTQGLKGAMERSIIPRALCDHIVEICEKGGL